MASIAAAALCLLSSTARTETGDGLDLPPAPYATRSSPNLDQERQSRYLKDLTLIKNATLESESVFFDRLEKEKKIEDLRGDTTSAAEKIKGIRQKLSEDKKVEELLKQLDRAQKEIDQAVEPLDAADKFITAGQIELQRFHERSTSEAVAVAAGKSDAAPLAARVRRLVKGAQRSMLSAEQHLTGTSSAPGGQLLLEGLAIDSDRNLKVGFSAPADGIMLFRGARAELKKRLDSLEENDPQRAKLVECDKQMGAASEFLAKTVALAAALLERLEATRRGYLPDCAISDGPALGPAPKDSGSSNNKSSQPGDCQGASLAILEKSFLAIGALQAISTQLANIGPLLVRANEQIAAAVKSFEQADAVIHPDHDKIRLLEAEAVDLLDCADSQLSNMRHLLTEDVPGQTKQCDGCGKQMVRTRKPVDPACVCAETNARMLKVEGSIQKALSLAEQMDKTLGPYQEQEPTRRISPIDKAREDLRSTKGVLDQLARALKHGMEFRKQQFDIYPGESSPPTIQEMPTRAFPPMLATYVARQSWHYPLYFEDISAERYGHHFGCVQPFVSYGKFLADLAMLPYNICLDPPCTLQYDLGLYRPGDDVPHLIYLPRWDCKAAAFEAGVWTGIMFTP